ncbi:TetR-like C-terminal domain-containing protein [Streptomyces sp. SID685]|uniref:TetR-like C-terminal domain-containing protein n=1 Tax=Streptomyces sp. SID685 TaxID=2690322 RepID=UPI0031FEB0A4
MTVRPSASSAVRRPKCRSLAEALTDTFLTSVHRRVEEAVRRAIDRGEIPPVEDIELLGDVVAGPVMNRFLLTPRRPDQVDAVTANRTADRLLPFILRAVGGGNI